jgi:putative sigma-54 modulation protein
MQAVEINGVHYEVDDNLRRYANKKLTKLERYLPKHAHDSAHLRIWLKESHAKDKKHCTCEVSLHLPHETITISESTLNMYAAIDIVQAKLKQRISKYRELHTGHRRRRLLTRIMRRTPAPSPQAEF